jgi:transcription elongation GreA/GreB family factor
MKQAGEIEQTIAEFQKMSPAKFEATTPIGIGALVEVKDNKNPSSYYFIGPRGGGVEIDYNGKEIVVLTPQAPLGALLIGKKNGESIKFKQGPFNVDYFIQQVW